MSQQHKGFTQNQKGPQTTPPGVANTTTYTFLTVEQDAEDARGKALASGSKNLANWANTLPKLWSIQDNYANLSGNDLFQAQTNCEYARTFLGPMGAASTSWCPKVFACTPDPTGHKFFIEGEVIQNAGSFASDRPAYTNASNGQTTPAWVGVWRKDLKALFAAAMNFAQKYGPYDN